jgi:RHS repeat-associated protein
MQPALRSSIPDAPLAVFPVNGENSHRGLAGRNPAPNQVREACNFTVLQGMRGQAEINRVGSRSAGKERDAESGNDYFGARYYGSSMGRFMSPDWTETPDPIPYADLENPQSLNLYGYVLNNPLSHRDEDGHKCDGGSIGPDGVFTIRCTNDPPPKMDDGRVTPGDDGLGLIVGYGIGKIAGMGLQGLLALRGAGETVGLMTETSSETINITEDGLQHVMERHVADGAKTAGKSLFKGSKGEVKALIQKAGSVKPTTQAGGNLERVVDAGRTIGTDRATNAPTSVYTVITKPSGDLVTAFPGRP